MGRLVLTLITSHSHFMPDNADRCSCMLHDCWFQMEEMPHIAAAIQKLTEDDADRHLLHLIMEVHTVA